MTTFYYPLEVTPNREDLIFDQITFNLELIDSPGEHLPFPNGFHTVLDPEDFFMWESVSPGRKHPIQALMICISADLQKIPAWVPPIFRTDGIIPLRYR